MTEFTKEDIEYYRKQYALWTSRRQTTPEELHLIGRLRDALDHIEHLYQWIEELEKERRWIPVSERFPGRDGFYLVLENTNQVAGYYHWCKQFGWNDGGRINIQSVTHWMPLPQPPEGE